MSNSPFNNKHILIVNEFNQLVNAKFKGDNNAICLKRNLVGDFKEIVEKLTLKNNITEITINDLTTLNLTKNGNLAREIIISDFNNLSHFGAQPVLNLLKCYEKDDEFDFISTDVYSYHVDRSPIETDTFLCTYYGATSDIIPNEDAEQKILIPEVRAKLKELYSDNDEINFENFLKEYYFDLHYQAKPNAKPINLENGNLWRLAVDHPNQKVLPSIHRAPIENKDEFRLLLIC